MRPDELLTLEQRISAERFAPYRAAVGDDLARAMRRYERNTEISAAFWAVLSDLEVVVRNAMHERLGSWSSATYGRPDWYADRGRIFTAQTASDIAVARRHAAAAGGRRARPDHRRAAARVLAVPALQPLRTVAVAALPARRVPGNPGTGDAPGRS